MSSPGAAVRIAAVGDVMMDREVGRHFAAAPADFAMTDIAALMGSADLVCANLENPVAVGGRPDPVQEPQVTFRAHPRTLDVLKTLGVDLVALGNNHMLDYGEAALVETLEHLDDAGIKRVGAGRNYEEANRPLLLERHGRRFAFLSYVFIYSANTRMATRRQAGVSDHRLHRILPLIRELTRGGYEVVVMIHWGFEYRFFPLPYQMRQARRMIDDGACLVLGHGPHYPQGIEQYKGRDIVYSLGNFIFDEPHKFANRSFVYRATIDAAGQTRNREIAPVRLRHHVPHLVQGAEKRQIERLVAALTRRYAGTNQGFWNEHSASYLTDICGRVIRSRSLKYLRVPPLSFYRDVGPAAILRKLKPANLLDVSRAMSTR